MSVGPGSGTVRGTPNLNVIRRCALRVEVICVLWRTGYRDGTRRNVVLTSVHQRGDEFTEKNGTQIVVGALSWQGSGGELPKGFHTLRNQCGSQCEPPTLVAALSDEDLGAAGVT